MFLGRSEIGSAAVRKLLAAVRSSDEAHGAGVAILVVIVVAIHRADSLGDVVAGIGYRELVGMTASTREAAASIVGASGGLKVES